MLFNALLPLLFPLPVSFLFILDIPSPPFPPDIPFLFPTYVSSSATMFPYDVGTYVPVTVGKQAGGNVLAGGFVTGELIGGDIGKEAVGNDIGVDVTDAVGALVTMSPLDEVGAIVVNPVVGVDVGADVVGKIVVDPVVGVEVETTVINVVPVVVGDSVLS